MQRESYGTEREVLSDGEGEKGYVWGSQRAMEYNEYRWHSNWLPGYSHYGEKKTTLLS